MIDDGHAGPTDEGPSLELDERTRQGDGDRRVGRQGGVGRRWRRVSGRPGIDRAPVVERARHTDGAAGTRKRLAVAEKFVTDFSIGTECGFGRRPPGTIPELLRVHAEVAAR